eukprot:jgi/Botrbrau1/9795/Bobra.0322s0003.1
MRGLSLLVTAAANYGRPLRQPGVRAAMQLLPTHPCCTPVDRSGDRNWLYFGASNIDLRPLSSFSLLSPFQRRGVFGIGEESGDISKRHQERKLIGYSPEQMYEVVADVEKYKEFVPWCQKSKILSTRASRFVKAELEVGFNLFVERYTSDVHLHPPVKVVSHVNDSSLFDHLDSTWEFKPGPVPGTTWLTFYVDFAFKSPLYRHVACLFFDEVVKRMITAFEARCRQVYGPSALARGSAGGTAPAVKPGYQREPMTA